MTTFADIELKAERILRDAGVEDMFPVNLEEVAKSVGYKSLWFDGEDSLCGAIHHDRKEIYVNKNHAIVRQRFTLAHEIGHAVLHQGDRKNTIDYRKTIEEPSDRKEWEANRFAGALLMPRDEFLRVWEEKSGNTTRVASYFGVSNKAAEIRAKTLSVA